ncbi:helix-turn-helix domain-containing protein [Streptomyces endophyticus]|uniref:Helix-turn-helix domain-containing protein n=1 Tax=Streptomyces endophyticus TaxID=714166 RepID=A0ABU6FIX9_9ACTN|nr:helix-turn-helix domain-containing protein [Streptomyces endophyticus]MEB8343908.1 helix-turn-helix domain-containing protein [Streptomyces endophyticus]
MPPALARPAPVDSTPERLHRPEEIAEVLGCSAWWVKDRARRRLIPFTRVGRAYRFTSDHLAEIIRMHETRPAAPRQATVVASNPAPSRAASRRPESAPTTYLRARPPRRAAQGQYGTAA